MTLQAALAQQKRMIEQARTTRETADGETE